MKILIAVIACHAVDYGQYESTSSPFYDPSNGCGYHIDGHISGTDPSIKVSAIRDTWFKDIAPFSSYVQAKFFYGRGASRRPLPDEVFLDVEDDYTHLPDKTRDICSWALSNQFDYVFKCDDDTAVYVPRLIGEITTYKPDYAGNEQGNVCHGGAGYILSKKAMQIVAQSSPSYWAEDVGVGHSLSKAKIRSVNLRGHKYASSGHWFWPGGFEPGLWTRDLVTMSAVSPKDMRAWYNHKLKAPAVLTVEMDSDVDKTIYPLAKARLSPAEFFKFHDLMEKYLLIESTAHSECLEDKLAMMLPELFSGFRHLYEDEKHNGIRAHRSPALIEWEKRD